MGTGVRHVDKFKTELLLLNSAGNTTTLWIDMGDYPHVTFFVFADNGTSPTGAAITVNQATATAGTSSKALTYNNYFSATGGFGSQAATADAMTQTTGVTGTFTTGNANNTNLLYAIEIQDTDLDLTNAFKAVQLSVGNTGVNTGFTVIAHCYPRFDGNFSELPTALT